MLITRPEGQERKLAERARALGASALHQPLVNIAPPEDWGPADRALGDLARFDWVAFTSANSVERALARIDPARLRAIRVAAIGTATAQRLTELGVCVELVPESMQAEGLADALREAHAKSVLLVQPDCGRKVLAEWIARFASVERIAVYRQVNVAQLSPPVLSALDGGEVDFVLLTSGNIARRFLSLVSEVGHRHIRAGRTQLITISHLTSAVVRDLQFPVAAEAASPGDDSLIDAMVKLVG